MRRSAKSLLLCAGLLGSWVTASFAGNAQSSFAVTVTLRNPLYAQPGAVAANNLGGPSYCTSQSLSQAANAVVTVVCASNQFVSIEPRSGAPFLGTDGGAYRFVLQSGMTMLTDDLLSYVAAGTVTTRQIVPNGKPGEPLEIEISF